MDERFYGDLQDILTAAGKLDRVTGKQEIWCFDDGRIRIEGWEDASRNDVFTDISVRLHLSDQNSSASFRMPEEAEGMTLVGHWSNRAEQYYRPGLWVDYVKQRAKAIRARKREVRSLNGSPIADDGLFRELA